MILFEQLRAYLNDSDAPYRDGVELLFRINKKDGLRESLIEFPDRDKLSKHLNLAYDTLKNGSPTPTISPSAPPPPSALPPTSELQALEDKRTQLFKELSHYHTIMGDLPFDDSHDQERYELMQKCVLLDTELYELRNDIIFYKRTGHVPQRKTLPKLPTEGQAQIRLKIAALTKTLVYDRKQLAQLEAAIEACDNLAEIPKLQAKYNKSQTRYSAKNTEIARLRAMLV